MTLCAKPAPEPTRAAQDAAAGLCTRCHSRKIAPGVRGRCEVCLEKDRIRYHNRQHGIVAPEPDEGAIIRSLAAKTLDLEERAWLEQVAREKGVTF